MRYDSGFQGNDDADAHDDELERFEQDGLTVEVEATQEGHVVHRGAAIWFALYGTGETTVLLLHGGLGNSGNWGHLVAALVQAGFQVLVIDSRGHGRSTRTDEVFTYQLLGADALAVMDELAIKRSILVGWSDGACTALVLGHRFPGRVQAVVFFGCNMDSGGVRPFVMSPVVARCLSRHRADFGRLSATPDDFDSLMEAVSLMQRTQPNYTAEQLGEVSVPVLILQAEEDEFIWPEHARYLREQISGARLEFLSDVSHFAPLQRPSVFNRSVLRFVRQVVAGWPEERA